MNWKRTFATLSLGAATLTGAAAGGVLSGNCRVGNQPAATFLIPYFEVDLSQPGGANTLFSVNNASAKPEIARVVLWTDWGVPTLAFDVYLTGYDVQTLNVRDLFAGKVPTTGPSLSPVGLASSPDLTSGCGGNASDGVDGQSAPAPSVDVAFLKAAHSGRTIVKETPAKCMGSPSADVNMVTGYITVDAVNRCTPRSVGTSVNTPAHPLYFAAHGTGLASDANVLWGDYYYVNSDRNLASSQTAVAIVADPDFFHSGDYTFYGRYVGFDSRDDRIPLSSLYYVRYANGGTFDGGTDLVVWRDNRQADVNPLDCGAQPSWAPLGEQQLVAFDEDENPLGIDNSNAFPLATQKVHVGGPSLPVSQPFGFLALDLWHHNGTHAQGWVTAMMTSDGRFGTGHEAVRVDDMCNFGQ
ncbi:MAG TPA: hypothetical protein VGS07_12710 [Thermoanaerobaculia bacterium]|jgi:hypothetical protein|nr:hypothetical protein [Thermoanaerobaculia bacterium]